MSPANSAQNTATVGGVIPEQVGHPSGSARRRAPPTGLRATGVATLRTKATLENCLAAACDRNNLRASTLRDIEAILAQTHGTAISAEQLRIAITAQLAKLPALMADIEAQWRRRGDQIDARRYPDELDDEALDRAFDTSPGAADPEPGAGASVATLVSVAGQGLSAMPAHSALHAA